MTFKEQLDFINNSEIKLHETLVAAEVAVLLDSCDIELADEDFEEVCNFCYNWYIGSELRAEDIASIVVSQLAAEQITIQDLIESSQETMEKLDSLVY